MKDKISDHQILLSLQCLRNWKSFTNWEILPGRGGDISHHTLFCCGAAHGYYSEPLRLPPGMELAQTLNSNIPPPSSITMKLLPYIWNIPDIHSRATMLIPVQGEQFISHAQTHSVFLCILQSGVSSNLFSWSCKQGKDWDTGVRGERDITSFSINIKKQISKST